MNYRHLHNDSPAFMHADMAGCMKNGEYCESPADVPQLRSRTFISAGAAGSVRIVLFIHATGKGLFNQLPVTDYSRIISVPAGEIIGFIAVALQNAACNVAAKSALTDDVDELAILDFVQALPSWGSFSRSFRCHCLSTPLAILSTICPPLDSWGGRTQ